MVSIIFEPMNRKTPFGTIDIPPHVQKPKIDAVHRALNWCENLLTATFWTQRFDDGSISLVRTINQRTVEVFPLEAAKMDLGQKTRFAKNHLPVEIDQNPVCVRAVKVKPKPLHTDMVAGMILLLGGLDLEPASVPDTMRDILTPEQRESLPLPVQRPRYIPGQPSTSGRIFLSEDRILELLEDHMGEPFQVQFEKRDGTLRNMSAQLEVSKILDEEAAPVEVNPRPYNPADYHLVPVIDLRISQCRLMAADRVTRIIIGKHVVSTPSAEE